tara:strand:+ start:500 stop:730 length:231 start_codon:yes stop_codon:yes gene_type:complete
MALPKKRTPTSKKRSRRSHHKFSVKSLMNSFDYKIKKLDSLNRDDEGKPFTLPTNDEATAQADSTIDDVPQDDSKD